MWGVGAWGVWECGAWDGKQAGCCVGALTLMRSVCQGCACAWQQVHVGEVHVHMRGQPGVHVHDSGRAWAVLQANALSRMSCSGWLFAAPLCLMSLPPPCASSLSPTLSLALLPTFHRYGMNHCMLSPHPFALPFIFSG